MNRIRTLSLTLLLLALALPALAVDVPKLIADAPGAEDYPTADVITLYERIDVTVDDEGACTRRVHQVRRILTNWAMRRQTDPRVGWDSSRQTLEVVTCRTYQAGGAIVDSPANALNEVTPDAVGRCAEFLDLREMVISHVGLEPGCVTELEYVVRDLEPGPAPAAGQIFLQDRWPVLERIVSLSGPGLQWELVGGAADVTLGDGVTVTARNVPGLPEDGNGAQRGDYAASVVYAFGPIAAAAEAMADGAITTDNARFVDWLAQGATEDADLTTVDSLQRIAGLVAERIATVHLPDGLLARTPRRADEVFDAGCASPWEKALLTVSLVEPLPVPPTETVYLVSRWNTLPRQNPQLGPWSRVVVGVQVDGEDWWLSPENGKAWRGPGELAGRTLLAVTGPQAGRTLVLDRIPSASKLMVDIRRDDDIYVASADWTASGAQRGPEMDVDALAEAVAQAVAAGSDVTDCQVIELDDQRAHLRVDLQFDDLGQALDDLLLITPPRAPIAAVDLLPPTCRVQEPVRHTPLLLPEPRSEEIVVRLRLPEEVHVDALPATRRIEAAGAYLECTVTQSQGVIVLERVMKLPGGRIPVGDWPALRGLLAAASDHAESPIVLIEQE